MCTVTFVPQQSGYILTSSRDEKNIRPTVFPQSYSINGKQLYFPKDEIAGGTWIATDHKNKTACLLNGAFENHQKQTNYRKSRGLILLESFSFNTITDFVKEVCLEKIEPFTLLLIDNKSELRFTELRWDGKQKNIKDIDVTTPHIWSSATLYDKVIRTKREEWFDKLIHQNNPLTGTILQQFHLTKKNNETANDIVMKRENGLQTVSISQLIVTNTQKEFVYFDIVSNQNHSLNIENQ